MRILPKQSPFWNCDASWSTYPFRIVWFGFWNIVQDRSGMYFTQWPHVHVRWNDED